MGSECENTKSWYKRIDEGINWKYFETMPLLSFVDIYPYFSGCFTIDFRYIAVQYNTILHTLQQLRG